MGHGTGERECITPKAGDADLWVARYIVVEVEHVKAHCTKKDKKDMSHLERFVIEGNEKAG